MIWNNKLPFMNKKIVSERNNTIKITAFTLLDITTYWYLTFSYCCQSGSWLAQINLKLLRLKSF